MKKSVPLISLLIATCLSSGGAVPDQREVGAAITPNPLVSVGKPVFSNFSTGLSHINDGVFGTWMEGDPVRSQAWYAWGISPTNPAWVAINVGSGYDKLLIQSDTSCIGSHSPFDYLIQTSADSTDGADGTWTTVVTFAGERDLNFPFPPRRARNHVIGFTGQRWVRVSITSATDAPSDRHSGVVIDELSCYDASNGTPDDWFFVGDSISAEAYGRCSESSFASQIHAMDSAYTPCQVNGGIPGSSTYHWNQIIENYLALYPDANYWLIMLGTNDSNSTSPEKYQQGMQSLIDRIKTAGHTPIIAKIPYNFRTNGYPVAVIQQFNAAIDTLNNRNGLMPGPDFFTYFQSHPEMFRDGVHPNREGAAAYCRLWAQAVAPLYRAGGTRASPASTSAVKQEAYEGLPKKPETRVGAALD